jgi:DNA-binding GntR family transcriptional regulator
MAQAPHAEHPPLERLARPRSLSEMVLDQIRELIVTGRLALGEQLSEGALAEQLGVSRTPVREAFLRLETENMVEVRPQRGTFVFYYDAKQLRDISELRGMLEMSALRVALARKRAPLIAALEAIAGESEAAGTEDAVGYQVFDSAFHGAIIESTDNRDLIEAYERISGRVRAVRYRFTHSPEQVGRSQRDHRDIVEALKAGRDAEAIKRLGKHVYTGYELFLSEMKSAKGEGGKATVKQAKTKMEAQR